MTILKIIGPPIFLTGVILVLGPLFDYNIAERISAVIVATLFCYLQIFISNKKSQNSFKF
ncbi:MULTISPECIES: hypothetical protein [Salimicrobium]|uniref:Uncharacterized protein n=1 Tax=Salimicrobium humidisoli TaxID=2029857 RepID=A0ABX4HNR7_9BACI|nr:MULTISPECIES: hypothetical protein [Salimicrobium]PBB04838.1 hypothetical protein CKW00_11870 [Salimicrobium humidisoli]